MSETEEEFWKRLSRGEKLEKVEVKPPKVDKDCVVKNKKRQQFYEFNVAKKRRIVNWVKFLKIKHWEADQIMKEMRIDQKMYDDIISFGALDKYKYD